MHKKSPKIEGLEVLSFEGADLTLTEASQVSNITKGTLSVAYFKDFDCFILFLNNWDYALNKALPIISSSKTDLTSRSYLLPTYGGYYTVTLNKISHAEAIQNFETILNFNSRLAYQSEGEPFEGLSFPEETSHYKTGPGVISKGLSMLSSTFSKAFGRHKEHINTTQVRDIESIKATDAGSVHKLELEREDVRNYKLSLLV